MRKLTLMGVLEILLPILSVRGQQSYAKNYPVMYSILPNIHMNEVVNSKDTTLDLYSIKDKLILIDFWNTHCSVCISHFRSLDSLQHKFADKLQVIMVTTDSKQAVTSFLDRWQSYNHLKLSMPFVVNDSLVQHYLPYYFQPSYVWISPRYRLIAKSIDLFIDETVIGHLLANIYSTAY